MKPTVTRATAALICAAALAAPLQADEAINATVETDPALHALLPEAIREAGMIKVGTDARHAPCDFMEEDNVTFTGWEEDYRQALGKKMGIKLEPTSIAFEGLIPGVQSGRFDMAMQCISDTPAREEIVDFVNVSISTNGIFAPEASGVTEDPLTLCGLTSGAQTGTTYGNTVMTVLSPYCEENGQEPIALQEFKSQDATILALLSGRVDFLVNDASSAAFIMEKSDAPLKVVIPDILPRWINGIVVQKGNDELAQALLAGAKAILEDGTYDKVMEKWGLTHIILREPGINTAGK
ncbi:ABC transporter substrate-binding protein [Salipiger sp. P9]|uniref:ABC transporter substrate-binding protein n=1 Tax=Salipiger pentaromativorans TaxID=2943193 RepID=UPI00215823B0|nr:ABC transporter substrate-binding protein [Salipiger pentaromativorans]MCR8548984.1 ABC transporter substrate-binding protein [Salipiger pentaromativorans]